MVNNMNRIFFKLIPDNEPVKWTEKEIKEESILTKKHEIKRKKLLRKALHKYRDDEIKQEYKEIAPKKKPKKGFDLSTTTKQLMMFIIINCSIIEIYTMVVMVMFQDLSALTALISAVVSESFSFMVYCTKSYLENRSEKNHEYDMEKLRVENDGCENIDPLQEDPLNKKESNAEIGPINRFNGTEDVCCISNE